jgi:hypothetical protein
MRGPCRWAFLILALTVPAAHAASINGPLTVTLYAGPSSTKFFGAVLQSLKLQPTGAMVGVAVDGRLLYLGQGISLAGEAQVTQYFWGHENTTVALGLGFQFKDIFGWRRVDWSIYAGPSYATDPPFVSIGYRGRLYPAARNKYLNFVGIEWAVGLGHDSPWQGVFRVYHRSGLYGVYSESDDDGIALGWGIRRSL